MACGPPVHKRRLGRSNILTAIRLRYYSGAMTPDLHSLAEKIEQLAQLTQHLRRENADLRLQLAAAMSEKAELDHRVQEACRRTTVLLQKLPQDLKDEEATA